MSNLYLHSVYLYYFGSVAILAHLIILILFWLIVKAKWHIYDYDDASHLTLVRVCLVR